MNSLLVIVLAVNVLSPGSEAAWSSGSRGSGDAYSACRAYYGSYRMCGQIRGSSCVITWNDKVYTRSSYEVLRTAPQAAYKYEWSNREYDDGAIPSNAVSCAYNSYVGRREDDNTWYLGKIDTGNDHFFYAKDGKEKQKDDYYPLRQITRSISRYSMTNVVYDYDRITVNDQSPPVAAARDTTTNNLDYDVVSTVTLEYSVTAERSWSEVSSYTVQHGRAMTVSAGVPLKIIELGAEATWETSETTTHEQSTSGSETVTTTVTKEVQVPLRAGETAEVVIWVVQESINLPYSATMRVVFTDGTGSPHQVRGIYTDLQQYEVATEVNPIGQSLTTQRENQRETVQRETATVSAPRRSAAFANSYRLKVLLLMQAITAVIRCTGY